MASNEPGSSSSCSKSLYPGGYSSVDSILRKTIKLDTIVHCRWQRLRGKSTHSQFANLLLDIFEENERRSLVPVLPNSNDNMQYVMKFLCL